MATSNKSWKMNETQTAFVKALSAYENGATMLDLSMAGMSFSTGSINCLLTKGIVVNAGKRDYECEVVYNGVVIGKDTRKLTIYKLAK